MPWPIRLGRRLRRRAAILHLNALRPTDGGLTIDPNAFAAFPLRIKDTTDAGVNISPAGSLQNTIEEWIAPALRFSLEICSMNMGSINISFHPLAKRYGS